jgi:hypothetical protein
MGKLLVFTFVVIPVYFILSLSIYVWTLDAAFGVQLVSMGALIWGSFAALCLHIIVRMLSVIMLGKV